MPTRKSKLNLRANRKRAKGASPNLLRVDPTRTATLRRSFLGELFRRFARVKGKVVALIAGHDSLGLKRPSVVANRDGLDLRRTIEQAARDADPDPSPDQREAGNYRKGHVTIQTLDITIETARGVKRKPHHDKALAHHYGYIKRTESEADGDHVDVFIGPDPDSEIVFIIDQYKDQVENANPDQARGPDGKWIADGDMGGDMDMPFKQARESKTMRAVRKIGWGQVKTAKQKVRVDELRATQHYLSHEASKFTGDAPILIVKVRGKFCIYDGHHRAWRAKAEGKKSITAEVFDYDRYKEKGQTTENVSMFDEHKVMLGFTNAKDAKQGYLDSYPDDWKGFVGMRALTMRQFKRWLVEGDTGKAIVGQLLTSNLQELDADIYGDPLTDNEGWVTLESDQRVYIGKDGDFRPHGPGPTIAEVRAVHNPESGKASARKALEESGLGAHVRSGKLATSDQIETASKIVHDEWVKREKTLPKGGRRERKHLHVAYEDLPEHEKEKDRVFVRGAVTGEQAKAGLTARTWNTVIQDSPFTLSWEERQSRPPEGERWGVIANFNPDQPRDEHGRFVELFVMSSRSTPKTLSKAARAELKKTVKDPSYEAYRGIGIVSHRVTKAQAEELTKLKPGDVAPKWLTVRRIHTQHDSLGKNVTVETMPFNSYTKSEAVAKRYKEGAYEVVLKGTIPADQVVADLSNLKLSTGHSEDTIKYGKKEKELIVEGDVEMRVHSIKGKPNFRGFAANFNQDQPRDEHGRWGSGGGVGEETIHGFKPGEEVPVGEIQEIVRRSPNLKDDPKFDPPGAWERFANRFGYGEDDGPFVAGYAPVETLRKNVESGHLRTSGTVEQKGVNEKVASGERNPVIISHEPGRGMLVIDGNHSLRAAIKAGDSTVKVLVAKEHRGILSSSQEEVTGNSLTANTRWADLPDADKVTAFQDWLEEQFAKEGITGLSGEELWDRYIGEGFRRGAGRAFDDVNRSALAGAVNNPAKTLHLQGGRDYFLRGAFGQPVAVEKVKLLAGRAFDELDGLTGEMTLKMSRALTDGLVTGASPHKIAKDLTDQVDLSRTRAETIARTEISRAHAGGQLLALKQLGVEEVGVMVEFTTAGDPCPECSALSGTVLKLDEAEGLIPQHPNCVVGETRIVSPLPLALMRAEYTGQVIEIVTAKGRRLTVTENHILLTQRGWVRSKEITKGDNLIDASSFDGIVFESPYDDKDVPSIADQFAAALEAGGVRAKTSSDTRPEYLHGDGVSIQGKIDVVGTNSHLWDNGQLLGLSDSREDSFMVGDVCSIQTLSLKREGLLSSLLIAAGAAATSLVGPGGIDSVLFWGTSRHRDWSSSYPIPHNPQGDESTSPYEMGVPESFSDLRSPQSRMVEMDRLTHNIRRYLDSRLGEGLTPCSHNPLSSDLLTEHFRIAVQLLGDLGDGEPRLIEDDGLVYDRVDLTLTRHVVSLPVYDVETRESLYIANGLISSNCRCCWIPANVGEDTKGQIRDKDDIKDAFDEAGIDDEDQPDIAGSRPWAVVGGDQEDDEGDTEDEEGNPRYVGLDDKGWATAQEDDEERETILGLDGSTENVSPELLALGRLLGNEAGDFDEDKHPRDEKGRFSSHPGTEHGSSVRVRKTNQRAWDGDPMELETVLTKQETGRVGEAVGIAFLKTILGKKDARPMNSSHTNFPVDVLEDHAPTEVKAGLASNSDKAQQWRLTFSKESKKEKELYAKMTVKQRTQWNAQKQVRIHERKVAVIKQLERQMGGKKITPRTLTVIVNPDKKVADVYLFDGYHDRIGWRSDQAKKAYVGSVRYDHAK